MRQVVAKHMRKIVRNNTNCDALEAEYIDGKTIRLTGECTRNQYLLLKAIYKTARKNFKKWF